MFFDKMKIGQFVRELQEAGCLFVRSGAEHDKWKSPITGLTDWVPRHPSKELGTGLERKLRKRLLGQ